MQTFATPGPVAIEIRNAAGHIRVDLADTDQTTVEVSLVTGAAQGFVEDIVRAFGGRRADGDEDRPGRWWEAPAGADADAVLDRVRIERTDHGDGDTVTVDTDPATRGWRTSFAVRVTAPSGCPVRVTSQSADVTVTGTAGSLDVRTASGDVVGGDVTDQALVHTASGDIRLQSVGGDLSCRSASGDIDLVDVGGTTALHSTSGDVRLRAPAGDTEVRTVSGDVHVGDVSRGAIRLTAVSGDIEIGVHPGALATVNLSTISGDTRSDLAVTDSPAGPPPERRAPGADAADSDHGPHDADGGDRGAGANRGNLLDIRVRTTSGDIRLRRAVTA